MWLFGPLTHLHTYHDTVAPPPLFFLLPDFGPMCSAPGWVWVVSPAATLTNSPGVKVAVDLTWLIENDRAQFYFRLLLQLHQEFKTQRPVISASGHPFFDSLGPRGLI